MTYFNPAKIILLLVLILISYDSLCQNRFYTIDTIVIKGNNITHPSIIIRELTFKQGDTIAQNRLSKGLEITTNNLKNLSLFNFITVNADTTNTKDNRITISVDVIERWYIWPYPIIDVADRNFNSWWKSRNMDHISYGFYVQADNFRGRAEQLMVLFKWGFDRRLEIKYTIPNINSKKTLGLSVKTGFMRNHEVALKTNPDNSITFLKSKSDYLREQWQAEITLTYRPGYFNQHSFSAGWVNETLNDSMSYLEPNLWLKGTVSYINLRYQYRLDKRDYKHYPLKGYYFDISAESFLNTNNNSFSSTFWELESNGRYYDQFSKNWYLSTGLYSKVISNEKVPYFLTDGLGNGRNFVRGYEYYLINGQQFAVGKIILKYALIPSSTHEIQWLNNIKFSKIHYALYLNLFTDHGIAFNQIKAFDSMLSNKWLSSIGIGLDFVTYYDRVFRLEYTLNKEKESGFYLHFIAPI
ncbi:MAG: hypothetical protein LWX70_09395 [Sphingobacteriia bacterium]|nr:hypothetical protein [Sphingobacteriia bacterium]